MNSFIESLNHRGGQFLDFAWPMLWQSGALISAIFILDLALRRKVRAAVRCALWLVVLVKLILPPTLALPTGATWWLYPSSPPPAKPQIATFTVTHNNQPAPVFPAQPLPISVQPPPPALSFAAWALIVSAAVSAGLLTWLLIRWRGIVRKIQSATEAPELNVLLNEGRQLAGLRSAIRLKLTADSMSPAVCGLFRPVILLPQSLVDNLSREQLRAVLLHEVIHLRRRDVWVNCAQALLQIVYWWHPLLWLANARIRRVREEAVDDEVMLALRDDAEIYAPTLLEVAKFAFRRPLASLGLVGIMESRSALRQRIERLMDFRAPKKTGLTVVSALGILAFSAVALPMGQAPEQTSVTAVVPQESGNPTTTTNVPDKTIESGKLVQDGKLLYEVGKFDDAEAKLKAALALNPDNQAAYYYMNLVKAAKTGPHPQTVHTSPGRETIFNKFNRIRLDNVFYDRTPLDEVVRNLSVEVKQLDPDKKGINFLINPNMESAATTRIDPVTGLPVITVPAPKAVDIIKSITVSIKPALIGAHLGDVLDAVVKGADKPIKYSVEDYGVVFSPNDPAKPQFEMRAFKVDPRVFPAALRKSSGTETTNVSVMAKSYFNKAGVDLTAPSRSIAFNDRLSLLFVKATASELDTIERCVVVLNQTDPQIHIKARFIEVPKKGFVMPQTLTNLTAGPMTGILSDPEFRLVLKTLEHQEGVITLAEPEVVTSSGRQTQMRATEIQTYVSGINPLALKSPGVSSNELFLTQKIECGPVLDEVPSVLSDGNTIYLTTIASMTEFLGYAEPTNSAIAYVDGQRQTVPVPLPKLRIRKMLARVNLWDGQTLILSKPDEQFTGPAGASDKSKKELLVLITATIIDPAGNRVHSDDELPFNPSTVPPQPQFPSPLR